MKERVDMARLAGALVLVLLLAACADGGDSTAATTSEAPTASGDGDGVAVVATTSILGDLATTVVGEAGTVQTLLPVGADPHDFAPSAAQVTAVREADLVVANGLDLEEGLTDALDSAEDDGVSVFHAADHLDLIPYEEGVDPHAGEEEGAHADEEDEHGEGEEVHADEEDEHSEEEGAHADEEGEHSEEEGAHADEDDEHGHGDEDPHVWFDVAKMAGVVEALGAELAGIDADGGYEERAAELAGELMALDEEIIALAEAVPEENRILVTNHEVLGYFADAYGFEVAATIIPGGTTLAEPSAADLEDVIDVVTETGASAIFAETTAGSRLAEVIAEEVGGDVTVVELFTESLSDQDGPAATYIDMMRTNAERITEALR